MRSTGLGFSKSGYELRHVVRVHLGAEYKAYRWSGSLGFRSLGCGPQHVVPFTSVLVARPASAQCVVAR